MVGTRVCVFSYMRHSEDQERHFSSKVRTFCRVITTLKGCVGSRFGFRVEVRTEFRFGGGGGECPHKDRVRAKEVCVCVCQEVSAELSKQLLLCTRVRNAPLMSLPASLR